MDLRDVPDDELRQMLADTERLIGSASDAARRLRRELDRRAPAVPAVAALLAERAQEKGAGHD